MNSNGSMTLMEVTQAGDAFGVTTWTVTLTDFSGATASRMFTVDYKNAGSTSTNPLSVNDHKLSSAEERWVRFIANQVVPQMGDDRQHKIRVASVGTWWALKRRGHRCVKPYQLFQLW